MKKPTIVTIKLEGINTTAVVTSKFRCLVTYEITDAYSEMIDALIGIKKSHDDGWHMISAENYDKLEQALKKAGCYE